MVQRLSSKSASEKKNVGGYKEVVQYILHGNIGIYIFILFTSSLLIRSFYFTAAPHAGLLFQNEEYAQSLIMGNVGIGMIIGSLAVIFLSHLKNFAIFVILISMVVCAISWLLLGLVSSLFIYSFIWAVYGVCLAIMLNLIKVGVQSLCIEEYRGRVSGILSYLPRGAQPSHCRLWGL